MSMVGCICRLAMMGALIGGAASAQILTGGVRGGIPWGPDGYRNFTIGPTVEFKPPIIPIRIVADALYKRVEGPTAADGKTTASVWDFPIMARVELPLPMLRPFVGGGPTFRRVSLFDGDWQKGGVVGAGIRINAIAVKITPEFRYSHFGSSSVRGQDNQGEFLIGITF